MGRSVKLHIHGSGLSQEEVEELKRGFEAAAVKWIPGGHVNEIKKALHDAVGTADKVLLLQRGMHFMAVLNLGAYEWYTFEHQGRQLVVSKKTPGSPELREVMRFATIPAGSAS